MFGQRPTPHEHVARRFVPLALGTAAIRTTIGGVGGSVVGGSLGFLKGIGSGLMTTAKSESAAARTSADTITAMSTNTAYKNFLEEIDFLKEAARSIADFSEVVASQTEL